MAPTTGRAPARRRTTSSPKRQTPERAVAASDGDFELVELTSKPSDEDRVPLFSVDGTVYTIPKTVSQGVSLEYLRVSQESNENAAAQRLLERLLGRESYLALEQSADLDDIKMQKIIDMAQKIAFGKAEVEGGKAD